MACSPSRFHHRRKSEHGFRRRGRRSRDNGTLATVFILNNAIIFNNGTTDANRNPAGTAAECSRFRRHSWRRRSDSKRSDVPAWFRPAIRASARHNSSAGHSNDGDRSSHCGIQHRGRCHFPFFGPARQHRPEQGGFDFGAYESCDVVRNESYNIVGVEQTQPLMIVWITASRRTTSPGPGTTMKIQTTVAAVTATATPATSSRTGWATSPPPTAPPPP